MTYVTTIGRDRDGLEVETRIPLGAERRELRITTTKASRGISTCALVVQVAEDGRGFSFQLCGDYRKILARDQTARATEKALRTLHAGALAGVDAVLAEVAAFYADKVAA